MGFLERMFLGGGRKASEMDAEALPNPIPHLSSIANSVIHRCSRILSLSTEQLQQCLEAELPAHAKQPSKYARNLLEYCSFKTLYEEIKRPDYLADKEFRILTYDMMLAWETPERESESMLKDCTHREIEDDDEGSLFYSSATKMAIQVDGQKTIGPEAFSRIAPVCPAVADPISVHNLFDSLTSSSGGRLHFLIYDKYLKSLEKVFKSAKRTSSSPRASMLHLSDGEIILDVDGVVPTNPVLQHIGTSTWPGRLTLTNHALYFEALGVGFYYKKAVRYDLAEDLKQVIKRECTGPWGARLFDKAVMYKSSFLRTEPIFIEFSQFKGHSRRDYWFAIIKEVLNVHKFIRKYNLRNFQKAESLSEATLGIFRYRSMKEGFHILPSHFKTILAFNLTEKLPKGDKILEALYNHLEPLDNRLQHHDAVASSNERRFAAPFPLSLQMLTRMGFLSLQEEDSPEERNFVVGDIHIGEMSPLQMAVKESVCVSGRAEAARATVDQVKVKDIETNLAVMKELLFPLIELGKQLQQLVEWEDPFKSHVFLVLILYLVYRGWIRYVLPSMFFSTAVFMLWHKHHSDGKPVKAFQISPPPSRNPVELLLTLQEVVSKLETNVQAGNIFLLKLRSIMFAAFPQTTEKVAISLIAIAAGFAIIPFDNVLQLVLLEVYTRHMPFRKENSEKLIRRLREWWVRVPAAPVQVVEHQEYKNLK
ncbi:uncharacterized protein [Typha latifolia]|uniref:uncharacterized protein isoform X1 n=1 Tax=Typha latifolia TaxID=4733 RepID=UPI003C2F021F